MRNYTPKAAAAFDQVTELIQKAESLLNETIRIGIIYKEHLDNDDLKPSAIADIVGVHTRLEECTEIMDKVWVSNEQKLA